MAKNRNYNLQLQTPLGECTASADTMPGLIEVTPRSLFGGVLQPLRSKRDNNLDIVSRDLWAAFLERSKSKQRVQPSSISKAGCELDLIKCYLQGISIEETACFLSKISNSKISRSAVGRYWRLLNKMGPDFKARL